MSRLLNPQPSAYSCLVAMPDGSIGLLYESGPRSPYQGVVFTSFKLDWLKDGANR